MLALITVYGERTWESTGDILDIAHEIERYAGATSRPLVEARVRGVLWATACIPHNGDKVQLTWHSQAAKAEYAAAYYNAYRRDPYELQTRQEEVWNSS